MKMNRTIYTCYTQNYMALIEFVAKKPNASSILTFLLH